MKLYLTLVGVFLVGQLAAQDVVPKAKTKEERKAERKKMTLEQRIESTLPVDVSLPSASATLPGKQRISTLEDAKKYVNETVPNYGKEAKARIKKSSEELKKKQIKIFDGKSYRDIAVVKKTWRQKGNIRNQRYIEFYVLKEFQKPMPYHREMTWYEEKTKRFHTNILSRDPKTNTLLHGPYKEYRGDNLVKEGNYYLGVKDGRWMEYDPKDFTLLDKVTYNKGFLAESEISYYNNDSIKIKEVIPFIYGKKTGTYMRFYPDGTLAERGDYDDGKKIGKWREYFEGGGNRMKREIQHPLNYFDENESYTVVEYDEKGKVTFENRNKTN